MSYTPDSIILIGIMSLLFLSGIMALVFINYVKKIMGDLDNVKDIKPLIADVKELIQKVSKIATSLEVIEKTHQLEIDRIKEDVAEIFERLVALEKKSGE